VTVAASARRLLAGAIVAAMAALAATASERLPDAGPLEARTVQRLLLVGAARIGNRIVGVGDRGYIVHSDDYGRSWVRAKSPPAPLLTAVRFADERNGWAVGHDSVILATTDAGASWTGQFAAAEDNRPLLDVALLDGASIIAVGAYGAYFQSSDGGKTWDDRKIDAEDRHYNAILSLGGGRLLILGEAGAILVSDDGGLRWTPVPSPYRGSLFGGVIAGDGAVVAFGMRGRIYRSTDAGRTWTQVENNSVATLMGGTRLADGAIVLVGAGGTVLVSRDDGRSFAPRPSGTTRALSSVAAGAPGELLILGEAGPLTLPLPAAPGKSP
jgi:photosystem II stability/assembly factor-like uncharacterized protein